MGTIVIFLKQGHWTDLRAKKTVYVCPSQAAACDTTPGQKRRLHTKARSGRHFASVTCRPLIFPALSFHADDQSLYP